MRSSAFAIQSCPIPRTALWVNLADMRDAMKKKNAHTRSLKKLATRHEAKATEGREDSSRTKAPIEHTAAGSETDLIKTIMVLRADAE